VEISSTKQATQRGALHEVPQTLGQGKEAGPSGLREIKLHNLRWSRNQRQITNILQEKGEEATAEERMETAHTGVP
jgi:hypothetical protein